MKDTVKLSRRGNSPASIGCIDGLSSICCRSPLSFTFYKSVSLFSTLRFCLDLGPFRFFALFCSIISLSDPVWQVLLRVTSRSFSCYSSSCSCCHPLPRERSSGDGFFSLATQFPLVLLGSLSFILDSFCNYVMRVSIPSDPVSFAEYSLYHRLMALLLPSVTYFDLIRLCR